MLSVFFLKHCISKHARFIVVSYVLFCPFCPFSLFCLSLSHPCSSSAAFLFLCGVAASSSQPVSGRQDLKEEKLNQGSVSFNIWQVCPEQSPISDRFCLASGTSESGFLTFEKWKVKKKSFHSFSRSAKWKKMLSLFFEKCKVKNKCFHSFSRSEKWNQNASRSRSRSENSREFWTILEKRDFWTGWNQLVRKPGAEQGGGAHNCQWKRGEGDLFQAACTNDEQHLRTTINITNNDLYKHLPYHGY